MKESYEVRPSHSPWPGVMRGAGQPSLRSVHRCTTRLCIELRASKGIRSEYRVVKAKPITGSDSNGRLMRCVVPSNPVIILRTKLVSIEHSMNDVNLTECSTFVNACQVERYVLTTRHSG